MPQDKFDLYLSDDHEKEVFGTWAEVLFVLASLKTPSDYIRITKYPAGTPENS